MSQRNQRSQRKQRNQSSRSNDSSLGESSQSSRRGNRTVSRGSQNAEDYDQYTINTVKFVLNQTAAKLPIKRVDLVKECCNGNSKIFTIIVSAVQSRLKSIYGIVFHELASAKGGSKQYICFADNPTASLIKLKECDRRNQTLLLIVLSYIFFKGESVGEGVLLNFLERLDIDIDREHEYFGDVKKSMETFRKQLYLRRVKKESEASDEQKITIEWGERALMEFDRKEMLINIAEMFHKPTLYFKKQHMELMIEAENVEAE